MKNEIQTLVNMLFWEKYVDVISESNHMELFGEFKKVLTAILPSVTFIYVPSQCLNLHSTVFVVDSITFRV